MLLEPHLLTRQGPKGPHQSFSPSPQKARGICFSTQQAHAAPSTPSTCFQSFLPTPREAQRAKSHIRSTRAAWSCCLPHLAGASPCPCEMHAANTNTARARPKRALGTRHHKPHSSSSPKDTLLPRRDNEPGCLHPPPCPSCSLGLNLVAEPQPAGSALQGQTSCWEGKGRSPRGNKRPCEGISKKQTVRAASCRRPPARSTPCGEILGVRLGRVTVHPGEASSWLRGARRRWSRTKAERIKQPRRPHVCRADRWTGRQLDVQSAGAGPDSSHDSDASLHRQRLIFWVWGGGFLAIGFFTPHTPPPPPLIFYLFFFF